MYMFKEDSLRGPLTLASFCVEYIQLGMYYMSLCGT